MRSIMNGQTVSFSGERRPMQGSFWIRITTASNQTGWIKEDSVVISSDIEAGDVFTFGTWEQDNDTENGAEAIEWQVLAVEDGRVLVISKYGLDVRAYNEVGSGKDWEASALRKWMNEDFFTAAFNSAEQARILSVPACSGAAETDHVYQLDINDMYKYFPTQDKQTCELTACAEADEENTGSLIFWRPTYIPEGRTMRVIARPAFWLDTSDLKDSGLLTIVTPTADPVLTLTPNKIPEKINNGPAPQGGDDGGSDDGGYQGGGGGDSGGGGKTCHTVCHGFSCDQVCD
ncbi:MAG: hypothetical protein IKP86_09530, partial [Anaerolineaceae bacterium]|nr:hypothetical protein [Anaerolineaceae bacterium]